MLWNIIGGGALSAAFSTEDEILDTMVFRLEMSVDSCELYVLPILATISFISRTLFVSVTTFL